jgi:polynucleotide 5'-kinase involved in rRNA processing
LVTGISFRYIDVDIGFDDLICSGTLALSAADFSSGSFKRVCAADTASYFAGTVTPR